MMRVCLAAAILLFAAPSWAAITWTHRETAIAFDFDQNFANQVQRWSVTPSGVANAGDQGIRTGWISPSYRSSITTVGTNIDVQNVSETNSAIFLTPVWINDGPGEYTLNYTLRETDLGPGDVFSNGFVSERDGRYTMDIVLRLGEAGQFSDLIFRGSLSIVGDWTSVDRHEFVRLDSQLNVEPLAFDGERTSFAVWYDFVNDPGQRSLTSHLRLIGDPVPTPATSGLLALLLAAPRFRPRDC